MVSETRVLKYLVLEPSGKLVDADAHTNTSPTHGFSERSAKEGPFQFIVGPAFPKQSLGKGLLLE